MHLTKTLCKVASDYAKHYERYHGVCSIDTEAKRLKALERFPIEDVWGIGRKSILRLKNAGIDTAMQFATRPSIFVKNLLHKTGLDTWRELNGEDCILTNELPEKQSITCSRTFAHGITERNLLEQALCSFCDTTAEKLRKQHSLCRQIIVFAHTSRFQENTAIIHSTINLAIPTDNTIELTQLVLHTVRQQWTKNTPYKRAGIILLNIEPNNGQQQQLFDTRNREIDNRLQKVMDKVNQQYGKQTLTLAPQLPDQRSKGLINAAQKSPAYSTRIGDIITLHC